MCGRKGNAWEVWWKGKQMEALKTRSKSSISGRGGSYKSLNQIHSWYRWQPQGQAVNNVSKVLTGGKTGWTKIHCPFVYPQMPVKVESWDIDPVTSCVLNVIFLTGAISHPCYSKRGFMSTKDCLHQSYNISSESETLFLLQNNWRYYKAPGQVSN